MPGCISFLVAITTALLTGDAPVDYATQIKPLLATRCLACHGALKQEGSLRLDTAASAKAGGESGPAVEPGQSTKSIVIERITSKDESIRMPPPESGTAFTVGEVALLSRWIDEGAVSPSDEKPETDPQQHWAFQPIQFPVPPAIHDSESEGPMDDFLATARSSRQLALQPKAERGILLRRIYLDLIGLPPSDAELIEFQSVDRPDQFERVVDKLLASPHYGERWGRHWMDIWRYSDWWGLGADLRNSQKHIWHWRDWIIESLNNDVGYDEMIRQMLAADELYPTDTEKLRATGYLARQYYKFNRTTWLDETVEHTSKAFLGLTMNCAKCHDHKYDPIEQTNYYQFRAFFEPYQVRMDQLPGEIDLDKDGIPRAFDCNLETPTFLHVRGDEKRPKTDSPLSPGLPTILTSIAGGLSISTVSLPPESYLTGLKPFVLQDRINLATEQIRKAHHDLESARAAIRKLEHLPIASNSSDLVNTNFSNDADLLWTTVGGAWTQEDGKLRQSQLAETAAKQRATFEVPTDFEAIFQFAILDGKQWKSVGLSFDVDDQNEVFVYLSVVKDGSKLQAGYKKEGKSVYPTESLVSKQVTLGEPQQLKVQVRGSVINVFMDDKLEVAWRLPIGRKKGHFDLWAFDAKADFIHFELRSLAPSVDPPSLITTPLASMSLDQAIKSLATAELRYSIAQAEPALLKARVAADAAKSWGKSEFSLLAKTAATLEREVSLLKAKAEFAEAELIQMTSIAKNWADTTKRLKSAQETLTKCESSPTPVHDNYTSLVGSQKSPESNVEDEASRSKPFPSTSTGRRRALADWMTRKKNPLTARVAVNHVWSRHFGFPLVETVFDFGRKGALPSHPEILDYLATDLVDSGWEMKRLHRQLVTSRLYQTSSSEKGVSAATKQADPSNKFYWRMNPLRMESQVVRDTSLALAGTLDLQMSGPSVPLAEQERSRRRSLYFVHSHNDQDPFLTLFDNANVLQCYRRSESIVPQQALALSNSKLSIDAATQIAQHFTELEDDGEFISVVFRNVLATAPTEDEVKACLNAMEEYRSVLSDRDPAIARHRSRIGVIHSLMNHNDFITIR